MKPVASLAFRFAPSHAAQRKRICAANIPKAVAINWKPEVKRQSGNVTPICAPKGNMTMNTKQYLQRYNPPMYATTKRKNRRGMIRKALLFFALAYALGVLLLPVFGACGVNGACWLATLG